MSGRPFVLTVIAAHSGIRNFNAAKSMSSVLAVWRRCGNGLWVKSLNLGQEGEGN